MNWFKGDFVLKFYPYLEGEGVKKKQIEEFIESSTAAELSQQVLELEEYIKGGDKTLKEPMVTYQNQRQER